MGVSLLIVCSFVAIPAMAQKPGAPQSLPVAVTNTPNVNVANTPSVSVSNTPNVNVTNTPSVSVANTPSVNVANSPSVSLEAGASVAVTNPPDSQGNPTPLATLEAVQVYGSNCEMNFSGGSFAYCYFTEVPQGKQLVIQEFDAAGTVETGNRPLYIFVNDTIDGANWFTSTFMGNWNGYDFVATHQETRLYVPPTYLPICGVGLPQNSFGNYVCNISGFLVDVPSGQQPITAQHQKLPQQLLRRLPSR